MLGKLIKYDFNWINKILYVYYIILFIIAIVLKIVESFDQTLFLLIVDKIVSGMYIACAISIIITSVMRVWSRFISNVYKDESYLTHTLPVTKNQIFNSKIISSILSLGLSLLVIIVCSLIVYLNSTTIDMIKMMYQSLMDVYGSLNAVLFITGFVLIVILEVIYFMLAGVFGIVVGYRSNNNKLLKSIIIGIASYMFFSTISLVVVGSLSKFANFDIVAEGFPTLSTLRVMMISSVVVYIFWDLLYYFVSKHLLNKGVNVE